MVLATMPTQVDERRRCIRMPGRAKYRLRAGRRIPCRNTNSAPAVKANEMKSTETT
jgi:hypothetical protein